jgi:hypothetical protein
VLAEVFYDPQGADDGAEWIVIYNRTASAVDLSNFSIGYGGSDYATNTAQLSGALAADECHVVGGPGSTVENGNPVYDQTLNFSPDLQNSGPAADGIALFDVPAASITVNTVPIDAVLYGENNTSNLIDETGSPGMPDIGDAASGQSIERTGLDTWIYNATPSPNDCPTF